MKPVARALNLVQILRSGGGSGRVWLLAVGVYVIQADMSSGGQQKKFQRFELVILSVVELLASGCYSSKIRKLREIMERNRPSKFNSGIK